MVLGIYLTPEPLTLFIFAQKWRMHIIPKILMALGDAKIHSSKSKILRDCSVLCCWKKSVKFDFDFSLAECTLSIRAKRIQHSLGLTDICTLRMDEVLRPTQK